MPRIIIAVIICLLFQNCASSEDEWIYLFDGESLAGWTPSENPDSWRIENGELITSGPRSHLFYTGDVENHRFTNFEFAAEVMTAPGSNAGIYFHTQFQEGGWPSTGYEAQVINSSGNPDPNGYTEYKMTGSLYGVRNVWKSVVNDDEWFNYRILVQGKTIRIYINDVMTVDYTEPDNPVRPESIADRLLSSGTFALQCHDPGSTVRFRNIRIKPLPADLPTPGTPQPDQTFEAQLLQFAAENVPLLDLHVHLKDGLTQEQALDNARHYGFTYGIAVNAGFLNAIETEEALQEFLDNYEQPPHTYLGMQAEGREWVDLFEASTVDRFDYVFTDAMTWTNNAGQRMRLWIPEETEVGDPQDFMNQLVDHTEEIIRTEPIDILVNATYLPDEIVDQYDDLWTEARMDRVISALVDSGVALEINNRRRIPSLAFIQRAKAAGVKFTLGTNNAGPADLGNMAYGIAMMEAAGLSSTDMWVP